MPRKTSTESPPRVVPGARSRAAGQAAAPRQAAAPDGILNVATYNIHKGFSRFNLRMIVHEMRDRLKALGADIVFLQEVLGRHSRHAERIANWPQASQYEFLAEKTWTEFAYGRNAIYDAGHHGNAILSRFPIGAYRNEDISTNPLERRGLLYARIEVPGWRQPLHCLCVHLDLMARGRRKQFAAICERAQRLIPDGAPLILAGDFNDWRQEASRVLAAELGLREVFETARGRSARSFPAALPLLRLDRIYVRGFLVNGANILHGGHWARLSDHAALAARLQLA